MRLSLALISLALAAAQDVVHTARLQHRFLPSGEWTHFGNIQYDTVSWTADFRSANSATQGDSEGWYQLAVDGAGAEWAIGSTRACYLAFPGSLTITLFVDPSPRGLTLHSDKAPITGECPVNSLNLSIASPEQVRVKLQRPDRVYAPGLAPPPPVDSTTGQPAVPVEEKSFLRKYWLPLLGVGIFLIGQLGPEAPKERK